MSKILSMLAVIALVALPCAAQTVGVSGVNDLIINGQGAGQASPVANIGITSFATMLDF